MKFQMNNNVLCTYINNNKKRINETRNSVLRTTNLTTALQGYFAFVSFSKSPKLFTITTRQ